MKTNATFTKADILIPSFHENAGLMSRWAVIACDQFTSQPEYWERCRKFVGSHPSTLGYIMPEAYLGTAEEKAQKELIDGNMRRFNSSEYYGFNGFMYIRRRLPDGTVRPGLVGKIDLEDYSFAEGSEPKVRPTEKTVVERIPARVSIREKAAVELPHILVLCDDREGIFGFLEENREKLIPLYDFDLMEGGGHLEGFGVTGSICRKLSDMILGNEKMNGAMAYAVGDGNHSLAAAKAHWENVKKATGMEDGPARYVLCEVTPVQCPAIEFEPIYRLLKNCDVEELTDALEREATFGEDGDMELVCSEGSKRFGFKKQTHNLPLGTLQNFIDSYVSAHPGTVCDYIHGLDALRRLSEEKNAAGIICPGIDKSELFSYVEKFGVLPRKTFSMGEAESKRYYVEMRKIRKD